MSNSLHKLVSDLPEIYQMIYNHPEWNSVASRNCLPRLEIISSVYDVLSNALGRPLRVLDLGCAQGFYSLSLANKGASVQGIDHLPQNITLCQAIANEHQYYNITFIQGQIEEVINQLDIDQFDLVISLSVFHHIIHKHGIAKAQKWLNRLLSCVEIVLLELALKKERLYWGSSQPDNPLILFKDNAFYQQLAECSTHLSNIKRPLYLLSNRRVLIDNFCQPFINWSIQPHSQTDNAHKNSRRYFYGNDFICKVYYAQFENQILSEQERIRNWQELQREVNFLTQTPAGFSVASLLANGKNQWQGWSVLSRLPGQLLDSKLSQLTTSEREKVLYQLLQQLVILEQNGLYHDDVRTWNILVDNQIKIHLIDYGSISSKKIDCSWPENLFQALFITISEIVSPSTFRLSHNRPLLLSPLNYPAPYVNWLYTFCKHKTPEWNFALLLDLFNCKEVLPAPDDTATQIDLWIAASEKWLLQRARYENHLYHGCRQAQDRLEALLRQEIENRFNQIQDNITTNCQCLVDNSTIPLQCNRMKEQDFTIKALKSLNIKKLETLINQALVQPITQLRSENQYFYHHVNNMLLQSRSQRLMSSYHYARQKIKLLWQIYIKQCIKHLVTHGISNILLFLHRHPKFKFYIFFLLNKSGQYKHVKRIYRRVIPTLQSNYDLNHQEQKTWLLQDPHHRLPPAVNIILTKLRIK